MKKIIILLAATCFSIIELSGQDNKKNLISSYSSFGTSFYGILKNYGGFSYDTKFFYTIGLDYSRAFSKRWNLCGGLEYTNNIMTASSPEDRRKLFKANLTLVTIPVLLRYHFGKLFFVNGGGFFNIVAKEHVHDTPYAGEYHVGVLFGLGLGAGFEHEFNSGLTLSLNPFAKWNGIGKVAIIQSESLKYHKF
jgi:hypothetical protein